MLVGISTANIVLFFLAKVYYIKRNQQKDRKWNALSEDQKVEYIATTKDTGLKRLNIRFVH